MPKADEDLQEIISKRRREIKKELHITSADNKAIVGEAISLEVMVGSNIMILEDEFMSSYDCKTCKGSGQVIKECLKCGATGSYPNDAQAQGQPLSYSDCPKCEGKGKWLEDCKDCNGKGALLEIPDSAKARPTSGRIISLGPKCGSALFTIFGYRFFVRPIYNLNDRVAYSGYTGHLLPFKGNSRIRVMSEHEPFCIIRDVEGAQDVQEKLEFIDKDTAYDLT